MVSIKGKEASPPSVVGAEANRGQGGGKNSAFLGSLCQVVRQVGSATAESHE